MAHSAFFVLMLWCVAWLPAQAQTGEQPQLPPGASVGGISQLELSQRWWQWAFSFERVRSPVADTTGAMCASRQAGDVWFLAGTYGTGRTVRTCRVPYGKFLFFPLINYVSYRAPGGDESCANLMRYAAAFTRSPVALVLEVDGKRATGLEAHKLTTGCFSLVPGQPADAAGNGYYVALAPLSKGVHEINFGGMHPSFGQAVTYKLLVE